MQIYEVTDPLFKEYGKIIDSVELTVNVKNGQLILGDLIPDTPKTGVPAAPIAAAVVVCAIACGAVLTLRRRA